MLKFSAVLACLTGVILAVGVAVINWDEAETVRNTSYLWLFYLPAGLLFAGGIGTLQAYPRAPYMLLFAWGFMVGMAWMAIVVATLILESNQGLTKEMEFLFHLELVPGAIAVFGVLITTFGLRRASPRGRETEN